MKHHQIEIHSGRIIEIITLISCIHDIRHIDKSYTVQWGFKEYIKVVILVLHIPIVNMERNFSLAL